MQGANPGPFSASGDLVPGLITERAVVWALAHPYSGPGIPPPALSDVLPFPPSNLVVGLPIAIFWDQVGRKLVSPSLREPCLTCVLFSRP